jgi:hypothetical protein
VTKQQSILIAASFVYLAVLVATAWFTRATKRRITGALLGGLAVAIVGLGVEFLAHKLGWWHYPFVHTPFGPLLMYPVIVLIFAALALIGWRLTRGFGLRGQAAFLIVLAILGTVRDYRVAAWLPDFIVFAPGIRIVFIDAACWAGLLALALFVMRLVAGPANADPLARQPDRPTQTLPT